jgi:hypothetical protein
MALSCGIGPCYRPAPALPHDQRVPCPFAGVLVTEAMTHVLPVKAGALCPTEENPPFLAGFLVTIEELRSQSAKRYATLWLVAFIRQSLFHLPAEPGIHLLRSGTVERTSQGTCVPLPKSPVRKLAGTYSLGVSAARCLQASSP